MRQSLRHDSQQQVLTDLATPETVPRLEITLGDLISVLGRWKWRVAALAAASVVSAALLAWLTPPTYVSEILIAPVASGSTGGQFGNLSSVLGEIGGLASLAGVAGTANQKANESIAVLKSQTLTERYIEQNNLLPILYHKNWDPNRRAWRITNPKRIPTPWKATQYFDHKIRLVVIDPKTGLVTLTIKWTDARTAAAWANGLVRMANDYLRKDAIDETQRNIAYLSSQAAATNLVPVKQAIYSLLETQINKEMIAKGTEEYAFKVLDPAIPPERKSSPQPLLWIVIALAASQVLAVLAAYVRLAWIRAQPPRTASARA